MSCRKIANWMTIQEICRNRYAKQTTEEVEVRAMALARLQAEEEVCAFELEGAVAQRAMEDVVEEAAKVVVQQIHTVATKEAVEAMAKEAATVALRKIRHEAAMVSLEAVAKEAAKVAVHELRQGLVAREAVARMYMDNAATGEERVADAASVAAAWELIDGDETKVHDGDDQAEDDIELYVVKAAIRAASTQREAELAACAAMELEERRRAEELIATAATRAAVELTEAKAEQVAQTKATEQTSDGRDGEGPRLPKGRQTGRVGPIASSHWGGCNRRADPILR
jgi:hypothetical protein